MAALFMMMLLMSALRVTDQCAPARDAPKNPFLFDSAALSPFEDGLKMLLNLKERDESDKNSTADNASSSDFNLTFSGMGDGTTSDVADMERRGKNDTKKCLNDVKCANSSDCGESGKCVFGKCRCECIAKSSCHTDEDCFGSPCNDTCTKYAGFIHSECNVEDHCARGAQCLMGACVGGGRFHNGMYEAVSCSPVSAVFDCEGYGNGLCAMIGDICIRHHDPTHLGLPADGYICKGGVSATVGFPTCVSATGNVTSCGLGNTCMLGAHCGSCSCNL